MPKQTNVTRMQLGSTSLGARTAGREPIRKSEIDRFHGTPVCGGCQGCSGGNCSSCKGNTKTTTPDMKTQKPIVEDRPTDKNSDRQAKKTEMQPDNSISKYQEPAIGILANLQPKKDADGSAAYIERYAGNSGMAKTGQDTVALNLDAVKLTGSDMNRAGYGIFQRNDHRNNTTAEAPKQLNLPDQLVQLETIKTDIPNARAEVDDGEQKKEVHDIDTASSKTSTEQVSSITAVETRPATRESKLDLQNAEKMVENAERKVLRPETIAENPCMRTIWKIRSLRGVTPFRGTRTRQVPEIERENSIRRYMRRPRLDKPARQQRPETHKIPERKERTPRKLQTGEKVESFKKNQKRASIEKNTRKTDKVAELYEHKYRQKNQNWKTQGRKARHTTRAYIRKLHEEEKSRKIRNADARVARAARNMKDEKEARKRQDRTLSALRRRKLNRDIVTRLLLLDTLKNPKKRNGRKARYKKVAFG